MNNAIECYPTEKIHGLGVFMRTSRTSRGFQQIWKEAFGTCGGTASNVRDKGGFCLHAIFDTFHCMPESSIRQKNKNLPEINENMFFLVQNLNEKHLKFPMKIP